MGNPPNIPLYENPDHHPSNNSLSKSIRRHLGRLFGNPHVPLVKTSTPDQDHTPALIHLKRPIIAFISCPKGAWC